MEDRPPVRRLLCFFLLVPLSVAAAAAQAAPARPLSDAELEKAIRARFARSKCAAEGFTVRVQGGVATIEGRTAVVQRKAAATRMARTAGARHVVNKVQVDDDARQKAAANLAKGRRRAQVIRSEARDAR